MHSTAQERARDTTRRRASDQRGSAHLRGGEQGDLDNLKFALALPDGEHIQAILELAR